MPWKTFWIISSTVVGLDLGHRDNTAAGDPDCVCAHIHYLGLSIVTVPLVRKCGVQMGALRRRKNKHPRASETHRRSLQPAEQRPQVIARDVYMTHNGF